MMSGKKNNVMLYRLFVVGFLIIYLLMINCTVVLANSGPPSVSYSSHCQDIGWQGWKSNGAISGTTGQSRRMEAIKISVGGNTMGKIQYRVHCQDIGWQGWKSNGAISGTTGQSRRMEAIQIKLTNNQAYDVYYRVHVEGYGWLDWKKNGETAGTTGQSRRIEAIQIQLRIKPYPTISKRVLDNVKVYNNPVSYTKMHFMIDETGTKYLVAVAYDRYGHIVSYAPWNIPIDLP